MSKGERFGLGRNRAAAAPALRLHLLLRQTRLAIVRFPALKSSRAIPESGISFLLHFATTNKYPPALTASIHSNYSRRAATAIDLVWERRGDGFRQGDN